MPNETTDHDIVEQIREALAYHMYVVFGRRPTQNEMWVIYWSACDAIDKAYTDGVNKA
jgi:hypothetical protein